MTLLINLLVLGLALHSVSVIALAPLNCITLNPNEPAPNSTYRTVSQLPGFTPQPPDVCANERLVLGLDVSSRGALVDMAAQYRLGARFVYIRATYINVDASIPDPKQNLTEKARRDRRAHDYRQAAMKAGLLAGMYHVARPGLTVQSAYDQALYFILHGGGWRPSSVYDFLPGALVLEPFVDSISGRNYCDGLRPAQYRDWMYWFVYTYWKITTRVPVMSLDKETFDRCFENSMKRFEAVSFWIRDSGFPLQDNLYESWALWQNPPKQGGSVDHYDWFRVDLETLRWFARAEPPETAKHMLSLPRPGGVPRIPLGSRRRRPGVVVAKA